MNGSDAFRLLTFDRSSLPRVPDAVPLAPLPWDRKEQELPPPTFRFCKAAPSATEYFESGTGHLISLRGAEIFRRFGADVRYWPVRVETDAGDLFNTEFVHVQIDLPVVGLIDAEASVSRTFSPTKRSIQKLAVRQVPVEDLPLIGRQPRDFSPSMVFVRMDLAQELIAAELLGLKLRTLEEWNDRR